MSGLSLVRFAIQASRIRHCFRRTLIYLFRKQSAIGSIVPGTQMQIVGSVGVDDSSTNRLGSSVAERPACDGVVPGSIPGLAFSFSSYRIEVSEPISVQRHVLPAAIRSHRNGGDKQKTCLPRPFPSSIQKAPNVASSQSTRVPQAQSLTGRKILSENKHKSFVRYHAGCPLTAAGYFSLCPSYVL